MKKKCRKQEEARENGKNKHFSTDFWEGKAAGKQHCPRGDYRRREFVCGVERDAYSNDIYRSAVDAIARNAAKMKGSHIIKYRDHERAEGDCRINRILQIEPNPYMSAFDMLYKLITHYYLYNNAFAYMQRDERGNLPPYSRLTLFTLNL